MIYHPQSNRPMVNFQVSCDLAQVHTIHIHFRCSFVQTLWITLVFRFGRVLPPTLHAPIALRSSIGFACLVLATCLITIGTLFHASILAHPFSHSPEYWNAYDTLAEVYMILATVDPSMAGFILDNHSPNLVLYIGGMPCLIAV